VNATSFGPGWPYDIHSYIEVAPALGDAGYRVVVPFLRGYGTTRFLSADTIRNGQQSALAVDVIDLMDALGIESAIVAGFDWGARTANVVAALWPHRCKAMVSVSGYLIGSKAANTAPLPPPAELSWWYQFYFAPNGAAPATTSTDATSPSSSSTPRHRSGPSTTRPSNVAPRPSTMPTTSTS
jgi:pimeloyl-ACP methyl ester carboxylesterase